MAYILEERKDFLSDEYIEHIREHLLRVVRAGKVVAVNPKRHTVRVEIADLDKVVSAELPVLTPAAYKNRFFALPCVGDKVLCVFLPHGREQGFVLGSFYAPLKDDPPRHSEGKFAISFEDGTSIEYDTRQSILHLRHKTGAIIHIAEDGEVDIVSPQAIKLTAKEIHLVGSVHSNMSPCSNCGGRVPLLTGASPASPQAPDD